MCALVYQQLPFGLLNLFPCGTSSHLPINLSRWVLVLLIDREIFLPRLHESTNHWHNASPSWWWCVCVCVCVCGRGRRKWGAEDRGKAMSYLRRPESLDSALIASWQQQEAPPRCCLSKVCNSHAVKELSKWAFVYGRTERRYIVSAQQRRVAIKRWRNQKKGSKVPWSCVCGARRLRFSTQRARACERTPRRPGARAQRYLTKQCIV